MKRIRPWNWRTVALKLKLILLSFCIFLCLSVFVRPSLWEGQPEEQRQCFVVGGLLHQSGQQPVLHLLLQPAEEVRCTFTLQSILRWGCAMLWNLLHRQIVVTTGDYRWPQPAVLLRCVSDRTRFTVCFLQPLSLYIRSYSLSTFVTKTKLEISISLIIVVVCTSSWSCIWYTN